ncbi:AAA family ATPase [Vibrio parahaemolyticus]|uniref:AAA family ATPase n=1 Tax=Vibrio parahaemolyticus TaxID=670 RepID=UPI00111F4914|nr:AAA family ATPase [Vibrio parahaemolyticus]TPA69914.1 peptidyl-arginine deiminase [Vibrio parahaemolyticus]
MSVSTLMRDCIGAANGWSSNRAKAVFGDDSPEARKIQRRFKINAAAAYVGVSRQAIEKAEKEGRLPPADYIDSKGDNPRPIRAGYTLDQIEMMREHFGTQPYRPEDSEAVTLAIPGGKGGCYKTSTAVNFSQWCSLQGYRVLVIDIDPQAHLSMYFGYHPELNTSINDTVLPFMLGDEDDLTYCVKNTAWPKLDIIPSHLQMQRLERELPEADVPYPTHTMLQAGITSIADNYDIIIIDGHPDLGMGTMNMICASDVTLIATSTEVNDINSTTQLMALIADIYDENSPLETTHEPVVRVLPTKLGGVGSSSQANVRDIMKIWPGLPLTNGIRVTDEVGKGQRRMASIYEQADEQRSSPAAWKRANDIFEATFTEMLEELIKPFWSDEA